MTAELWFVTTILPIAVGIAGAAFYFWHKAWLQREISKERSGR